VDIGSIRQVPLFRDLPDDTLRQIAERLRVTRWSEGAIVFRKGDEADGAYLVQSGVVEIVTDGDDGGEAIATLGPGSVVGELALLTGEPRSATLRAGADTELVALGRADFEALLREHPMIGLELSRQLGRRLVDTTRRLTADTPTRITAVWGADATDLAAALLASGAGSVGRLVLPGARPAAARPAGLVEIDAAGVDAATITAWVGTRLRDLDHLLVVLPDRATHISEAARAAVRHVITFGPAPTWMRRSGRHPLHVRCDPGPDGVARALRWVTGRAVGLALSSGGSKTIAHVGVIQVLRERGIVIDAVTGCSGGALSAVAVAFDIPQGEAVNRVHELARHTRLHRFDFHVLPRAGFFKGVRIRRLFESWMPDVDLTDSRIPVWLLATNVHTGAEVVLDHGPVSDTVRASMSIPAAFDPWIINGEPLMDGAVVNPLPASVLRDAGIGTVIASNVAGQELTVPARGRSPHLVQTMARMITSMERELIKSQTPLVDIMIRPEVRAQNSFDFSSIDSFVAEGVRAARAGLDALSPAEWARVAPQPVAGSVAGSGGSIPPTR